uniref:Predicted protein n=1 Tax=Hordeum vulgare subsp. vulgare TaxID=112509 RepID=F2ECY9_HORVV|nr:predicted protein [Hordeum vulgare subsp. vulgare]
MSEDFLTFIREKKSGAIHLIYFLVHVICSKNNYSGLQYFYAGEFFVTKGGFITRKGSGYQHLSPPAYATVKYEDSQAASLSRLKTRGLHRQGLPDPTRLNNSRTPGHCREDNPAPRAIASLAGILKSPKRTSRHDAPFKHGCPASLGRHFKVAQ